MVCRTLLTLSHLKNQGAGIAEGGRTAGEVSANSVCGLGRYRIRSARDASIFRGGEDRRSLGSKADGLPLIVSREILGFPLMPSIGFASYGFSPCSCNS